MIEVQKTLQKCAAIVVYCKPSMGMETSRSTVNEEGTPMRLNS
jgi:hypothetical protein